ncbi:MAG: hypothetical protein NVSMB47_00920 [Polyangiales bacterium]
MPGGRRSAIVAGALLAVLGTTARARAQSSAPLPPEQDPARWLKELDVEAGTVEADVRLRELELKDGVRVGLPPYHLRADQIHLSLTRWGVRVRGKGELGFCPCEDPPIAIGFSGGYAAPPDELIVENPTLRVFGVPVLWLPWLWLRSPRKIGLTTPEVSFRGGDGLFLGQGVHVPLGAGLELGVGAYTRGGVAAQAALATERTHTRLRADFRSAPEVGARTDVPSGTGLAVDAYGELGGGRWADPTLVWDADAIRGARGVRTTLDLEPLARPFDRGAVEAHVGPAAVGVDVLDRRGETVDHYAFARPWLGLGGGVPLGELGSTSVDVTASPRIVRARRADAIADASWRLDLGAPLGPAQLLGSAAMQARAARSGGGPSTGDPSGRAAAAVGEVKLELSLPLARALSIARAAGGPPILHVIEPLVRGSIVGARGGGDREALAGFAATPLLVEGAPGDPTTPLDPRTLGAAVAALGARTTIGAMAGGIAPGRDPWIGRIAIEAVGGTLIAPAHRDAAAAGRLEASTRRANGGGLEATVEGALTRTLRADLDRTVGWLMLGRVRGDTARDGLRVEARGSTRGALPVLGGWALLGADAAPRISTATGLIAPGATLGVGVGFPLGLGLRVGGDVDAYADSLAAYARHGAPRLLDLHSTFRYRHPCGCFQLGLRGGHVVGREGLDVFATLELAQVEPRAASDW